MAENQSEWELFEHRGASRADKRPMVSLQMRGAMQFNRAAYQMLGKPEAVQLLYNRNRKLLGFRPATQHEHAAHTIRKAENAETYSLAAKSLANYYDIDISQTRRYELKMYDDIPGIDLNAPDSTTTRARRATK